jgi:predicted phosphodiesterase
MELHVLSDIHLEFAHFNAPQSDADVIVLAGDIGVGVNGLFWAASQEAFMGKPIVYVSGNHEYYGTRLERTAVELRATAKELGIHYLDNDMTEVLGVTFIGATLWSDFELFGAAHLPVTLDVARTHLADCGRIVYGTTGWIRPEKMIELHRISRRYLEKHIENTPKGRRVVVTHHAPSMQSIPEHRRNNPLSAAYASRLDEWVGRADIWIHGHVHQRCDYEMGACRVVCNPRGYTEGGMDQETGFQPGCVVDMP